MQQFEKTMARILLLNGGLTLLVVLGIIGPPQQINEFGILLAAALLGILSAVLALRGRVIGWWGALVYYGLQLFSYYPMEEGGLQFAVKAGVSYSLDFHLSHGIFLVNLIALAFIATTAVILRRRFKQAGAAPNTAAGK
ncbi:hypothetical protein [Rugamonas sp.]|uniref:hypothetical protein n=1 Tax=Rugamonas sp. TaxID=1926287 RepID=UPI0025E24B80|nr:hypothetical protein [Rugamonas sp.]